MAFCSFCLATLLLLGSRISKVKLTHKHVFWYSLCNTIMICWPPIRCPTGARPSRTPSSCRSPRGTRSERSACSASSRPSSSSGAPAASGRRAPWRSSTRASAGATAIGDFKDTVFTSLRIILRFLENFMFFVSSNWGPLTVSFKQYPGNPPGNQPNIVLLQLNTRMVRLVVHQLTNTLRILISMLKQQRTILSKLSCLSTLT